MAQDFHANTDRAMQAATAGFTWAREFAEESFSQGQRTFAGLMRVTRKMAEDWEAHAKTIREHASAVTEKSVSNAMEYGQKLAKAKEPQEFAQYQSEYLARQAQTVADGTKEFTECMQQASRSFQENASNAMSETSRRTGEAVSTIGSRTEQASRRQRAES